MDANAHSIGGSLRSATQYLAACGVDDPRADAEIILAHVLDVPRQKLIARDRDTLPEPARLKFNRLIARRGDRREPVAYIVRSAGFFGLELAVAPCVLIPRPATETLVERAIACRPSRFADIGTGSGAIAVAILTRLPKATAVATDIEDTALYVARRNAQAGRVLERLDLRQGDLFAPLGGERFDLIASNPPYVAESEFAALQPELRHEPRAALVAGPEGTEAIRRIVAGALEHLVPGGRLLVEVGAGQAPAAREFALRADFHDVTCHKDLQGIERVMEAC
ncbi:MAG: peptide chain release factor N(5)-glutamine methyltransferase [Planctomycetes bacterium]|nr:peptide chain release factor N(5)-glutamine methyltransferase [Planctomycetota bacterium]